MQGVEPQLFAALGLFSRDAGLDVPLAHPGIKIPAEVIDERVGLVDLGDAFAHAVEVKPEQVGEADDHIRHLHAGVVDVVLDADLPARVVVVRPQQAGKGVAQDGIAQVADVRGFVGVDAGVLDEPKAGSAKVGVFIVRDAHDSSGAVEPDVQVARARDFD